MLALLLATWAAWATPLTLQKRAAGPNTVSLLSSVVDLQFNRQLLILGQHPRTNAYWHVDVHINPMLVPVDCVPSGRRPTDDAHELATWRELADVAGGKGAHPAAPWLQLERGCGVGRGLAGTDKAEKVRLDPSWMNRLGTELRWYWHVPPLGNRRGHYRGRYRVITFPLVFSGGPRVELHSTNWTRTVRSTTGQPLTASGWGMGAMAGWTVAAELGILTVGTDFLPFNVGGSRETVPLTNQSTPYRLESTQLSSGGGAVQNKVRVSLAPGQLGMLLRIDPHSTGTRWVETNRSGQRRLQLGQIILDGLELDMRYKQYRVTCERGEEMCSGDAWVYELTVVPFRVMY